MGLLERLSGGSRTILSGDESEFAAVKPTPSRGSREGVWEREGGNRGLANTGPTPRRESAASGEAILRIRT